MEVTRRGFLGGLAGLGAAAAVPWHIARHMELLPNLWRDGVHDDTPGLQGLIDGEKVWDVQTRTVRQESLEPVGASSVTVIHFPPGKYLVKEPISVRGRGLHIENSHFVRTPDMPAALTIAGS